MVKDGARPTAGTLSRSMLPSTLDARAMASGFGPVDVLRDARLARFQERAGRNNKLVTAARWADCYPGDSIDAYQLAMPGGERPIHPGGDGTPTMAGFKVAELGVELGLSAGSTTYFIADALDLRHRLPRIWERLCRYEIEGYHAQKVARETRHLNVEQATIVDATVAHHIGRWAWARVMRLVDSTILEVDAERIAKLAKQAATQTGVWVAQSTEHGTKTVYMRITAADAIWFDAIVDQIADILARRGDHRSKDQRRAAAIHELTNPLQALKLLAEDTAPSLFDPTLDTTDESLLPAPAAPAAPRPTRQASDSEAAAADDHQPLPEPDEVADPRDDDQDRTASRFPRVDQDYRLARAAIRAIGQIDPAKLRPDATLYVHIAHETLTTGLGITRVEDLGPIVSSLVADWLTDCHVTVRPVIDLAVDQIPVDAYEIPRLMRERLFLKYPGSCFPFSAAVGRRLDLDHSTPYREALPAQTAEGKLGRLVRPEHRVVTHSDFQRRQPEPGSHLFRAPHGTVLLVNQTGTHDLGRGPFAQLIWHATAPGAASDDQSVGQLTGPN